MKKIKRTKWMSENGITFDLINGSVSLRSVVVPNDGKITYYHTSLTEKDWDKLSKAGKNGVVSVARSSLTKLESSGGS